MPGFPRCYAAASLAVSIAIFALSSGAFGVVIAIAVVMQAALLLFITNFWRGFERFSRSCDWAAGALNGGEAGKRPGDIKAGAGQ